MKRFNKIFFVILTMIAGVTMLVYNNAKQHKVVVNELKNDMKFDLHTITVNVINKDNLQSYTSGPATLNVTTGIASCEAAYSKALENYKTFTNISYGLLEMTSLPSNPYANASWCPQGYASTPADLSQSVTIKGYAVKHAKIYWTLNNSTQSTSTVDYKVLDGEDISLTNIRDISPTLKGYRVGYMTKTSGTDHITSLSGVSTNSTTAEIRAVYEPKVYAVLFNPEGGKIDGSTSTVQQLLPYNTTYYSYYNADMPTPSKTGYDFMGWYTETNGNGTKVDKYYKITEEASTRLYAYWVGSSLNVTFNGQGGEFTLNSQTGTSITLQQFYGENYRTPSTATKTGYRLKGWYTQASGGDKVDRSTPITNYHDHTIYAQWEAETYYVTLDPNGGSLGNQSNNYPVVYGEYYMDGPTPTREGYTFTGWYTDDGTKIDNHVRVTTPSNITLYAHWSAAGITVTLNLNASDASFPSGSSSTKTVYYGETYGTMPTPRRAGYVFKGWYDSATGGRLCQDSARVTNASNHTLYAHWEAMSITVSFNGNNGTASSPSKTVTYGQTYGDLPTATRTGYNFLGWYDAATGGTKYESSTTVSTTSTTQTLYAHWEAMKITVTFNPNEGSLSSSSSSTKQVTYKGTYGTLPTATRYGYDFLGWYDQQSGGTKYESSTTVNTTSNQILYAHWQVKNVVIKFNANNGSVSPTQKTVTYGAAYGDLPTPTREGYDFAGWYTAASGGNKVTSSSTVDTISEITIFAHWNQEQILDGGIIKINNSGVLISVSQYKGSHSDVTKVMNSGGQEKASTANIVTGDHLLKGNKEYRVVVIGDVDGNGKTNTTDFARIWKHMDRADSFTFTDELQLLAADVDESGEVKTSDYSKLWKMIKRG